MKAEAARDCPASQEHQTVAVSRSNLDFANF
jgi:hypothetical protein